MVKLAFWAILLSLMSVMLVTCVQSYRSYIDPANVYGNWIEIGAPEYQIEVLTLSPEGVYRNHRLISTDFEFDGKNIRFITGNGISVYRLSGTYESPQLSHDEPPPMPIQRFIKQGFEATLPAQEGAAASRRSALAEHFRER